MINLTPHPVTIRMPNGETIEIPTSGSARVIEIPGVPLHPDERPDGLPCWDAPTRPEGDAITGLPASEPGVSYLVSLPLAHASASGIYSSAAQA